MNESDGDLVQRARQGDREAFRELVERYQRKIAALAVGMLRNDADALDVVQDTFTKAYRSLDRFKGDSSFYTWLYRIAMNVCIDHQRRSSRLVQVPIDLSDRGGAGPVIELEAPAAVEPFQRSRNAEIARHVGDALAELTPEHRAVIVLREVEGLSYDEISDALDCPKGTVMSRLHYARRRLQARLKNVL